MAVSFGCIQRTHPHRCFLYYDAENRLTSVSGTVSTNFTYNGDGQRVTATIGTASITTYIGGYYEWKDGVGTSYYFAGAQRVAMRASAGVEFLLGDHLGSTSLTVNSLGGNPRELRYYPWGEVRWASGTTPTDYRFTGQQEIATIGLYFFNSRFYDASLGRFVSPDTIIPQQQGTQAWDRYAFVNNNPLKFTDPTGHGAYCGDDYDPGCLDDQEYLEYLEATNALSKDDTDLGCNNPGDLYCLEFSAEEASKYWEESDEFADAIDIFGLVSGAAGLGLTTLGFLTKQGILTPEFISLMTLATISPEGVTKIGLVITLGTLYAAAGSFEMGNFRDEMVRSGILESGGIISVSLMDANAPIAITLETEKGIYQVGNWTAIPAMHLLLWATINAPPGTSWKP